MRLLCVGLARFTLLTSFTLILALSTVKAYAVTEDFKLLPSDGAAGDLFGYSVAVSGDTAIVGAYFDDDAGLESGSAYVFIRNGGVWVQEAKLTASDGAADDQFGWSVSLDGDTAIIGAYQDNGIGSDSGSAYVFTRSGGVWTEEAKLIASDEEAGDLFGGSVSVSGDIAIVGAYSDNDGGTDSGSAYVFTRSGTVWTEQDKLIASDAADFDFFGYSVSLSGNTAIIGAWLDDDNGSESGSAYIFVDGGTGWAEEAKLVAGDAAAGDRFGYSVSISGDTVIAGSYFDDDGGLEAGAAYVFTRSAGIWTQEAKLIASDAEADDQFGYSVTVTGNTAVVGAWKDDDGGSDAGSAYIFTRNGSIWSEKDKLVASDAASGDFFGQSVSESGGTAVVGAYSDDDAGFTSGSAYIFRDSTPPTATLSTTSSDPVNTAITVDIVLSEVSVDFDETDLTVNNATVSGFTGNGLNYSFTLTPGTDGSFSAQVNAGAFTDAAGNNNNDSNVLSLTADFISPTLSLGSVAGDPVNGTITVDVTLSEDSADFDAGDINATNATVSGFTGSGSAYSFDLTPTTDGAFSAEVLPGSFTDLATNGNLDSNSISRIADLTDPGFSSITANPSSAQDGNVVTITFVASETLQANPTVTVNGNVASFVSELGLVYTYTYVISILDSLGPATIDIVGLDAVGNTGVAADSTSLTIIIDPSSVPLALWPSVIALAAAGAMVLRRKR